MRYFIMKLGILFYIKYQYPVRYIRVRSVFDPGSFLISIGSSSISETVPFLINIRVRVRFLIWFHFWSLSMSVLESVSDPVLFLLNWSVNIFGSGSGSVSDWVHLCQIRISVWSGSIFDQFRVWSISDAWSFLIGIRFRRLCFWFDSFLISIRVRIRSNPVHI